MKQNHIHKYLRVNSGRKEPYYIYKCVDNCSHFIHESMIHGRETICWECGKTFRVRRMKKRKPICEDCWSNKYGKLGKDDAESILKDIGVI